MNTYSSIGVISYTYWNTSPSTIVIYHFFVISICEKAIVIFASIHNMKIFKAIPVRSIYHIGSIISSINYFRSWDKVYSIGAGVNNNEQVNAVTFDLTGYSRLKICYLKFSQPANWSSSYFQLIIDSKKILELRPSSFINNPEDGSYEYDVSNNKTCKIVIGAHLNSHAWSTAAVAIGR